MKAKLLAAVVMAAGVACASSARARDGVAPPTVEPAGRCKNNVKQAVRGHALLAKLLCADGSRPQRQSVSSRFRADGCLEDTFHLRCGEQRLDVVVPPDGPPMIPDGLHLMKSEGLADFQQAQAVLEKDPGQALKLMDGVLKREPNVDRFWRLRGLSQLLLKKPTEALWDFDKVVQLSPGNSLFRLEHAEVSEKAGLTKQAISELRALDASVDPEWARRRELLAMLAKLLTKTGDPEAPAARARACDAGAKHLCSGGSDADRPGPPAKESPIGQ
ncbi:MAG TPA: hypothetical protein VGL59_00195 [Polyangia bacterium]